jgi:hypothetical protein
VNDKSANDAARYGLLGFMFLTIVPFGSNRPFFWGFWSAAVAVMALAFLRAGFVEHPRLGRKPFWLQTAALLFGVYVVFLVAQIVPIETRFAGGLNTTPPLELISRTLSIAPLETWFALLRWATYGVLFILVFQLSSRSRSSAMMLFGLSILAGLEAIYALTALLQLDDTILIFDKESYFGVATGTFVNRNSLATFLSLGAIVSAVILTVDDKIERRYSIGSGQRLIAALCFAFIMAALFATNSRMGLFAGSVGVVVALLLRAQTWKYAALIGLLAIFIGSAGIYFYGFGLIDRVIRVEGAFDGRFELYQNIWSMIKARPLTGYGDGAFAQAYLLFHVRSPQSAVTWEYAHSTYLALWSGAGLVFGTLPMLVLLFLAAGSVRRSRQKKGCTIETAVVIGATLTVALHSLVDFGLEMEAVAIFYVTILGIACSRACQSAPSENEV